MLIEESLKNLGVLALVRQLATDVVMLPATADGQLDQWTLISFEVDDTDAVNVADRLRYELVHGHWYVDFNNGEHSYVVFADHVFDYRPSDATTLDADKNHARGRGIPEGQIDWQSQQHPDRSGAPARTGRTISRGRNDSDAGYRCRKAGGSVPDRKRAVALSANHALNGPVRNPGLLVTRRAASMSSCLR